MALWTIEYWCNSETGNSPVEKWIHKLEEEQERAITKLLYLLKQNGNDIELPHSKALSKGLFELRERDFGLRVYYGFHGKYIILLLAAGNKTSQDKDIKIARQRLSQIKKG